MRGVFEALRISLPTALVMTFSIVAIDGVFAPIAARQEWALLAVCFVAACLAIPVARAFAFGLVKWLLVGAFHPGAFPMWSWRAIRTEGIEMMYWEMAGRSLLQHFAGTPLLPWITRGLGARIGRGVYLNTTDLGEFDCVTVGDYAVINRLVDLQTHLYEDRVMKLGRIVVEAGAQVGAGTTILYDTVIGANSVLGPLTLVMKGETIPAGTAWTGSQAVPMISYPVGLELSTNYSQPATA
jgi:non-ribosomal peptide synthetase-like protein